MHKAPSAAATLPAAAFLAAAFLAACAGESRPAGRNDPVLPDCPGPCLSLTVVDPPTAVLRLSYNQTGQVRLRYADAAGAPVIGAQVNFTTLGDTGGAVLQASSGTTDAAGEVVAAVVSRDAEADFDLVAAALKADNATARISVRSKEGGDVEVRLTYRGRRDLLSARVLALAAPVACADLDPANLPTALDVREVESLRERVRFTLNTGAQVALVAVGAWAAPGPAAFGCHAGPVVVKGGAAEVVEVALTDIPPSYGGTYDVVNNFDLVEALPPGIALYIDELGRLFQDPGATAVDWLRRAGLDIPEILAGVLAELATGAFEELTAGTTVGTVFQAGGEIYDILAATEVRSTLFIHEEPGADGVFGLEHLEERWDALVVRWTTGVCEGAGEAASADGCGVNEFGFADADMDPIHAFPAGRVGPADPFRLTVEPHGVKFDYGRVALFLIEKIVLPRTVGYDSFDAFFYELLGGRGCLEAAATDPGDDTPGKRCCRAFSERVVAEDGFQRTTARGICNSGVGPVVDLVRGRVETLEADSGENMTLGTRRRDGSDDTPCELFDQNSDNVVESLGLPPARRCKWQVEVSPGAGAPLEFTGTWNGARLAGGR